MDSAYSLTSLSLLLYSWSSWRWHHRPLSNFQLSAWWVRTLLSSFWTLGWRSSCSLWLWRVSSCHRPSLRTLAIGNHAKQMAHMETDLLRSEPGFELSSFANTIRNVQYPNVLLSSYSTSMFQRASLSWQPMFSCRCRFGSWYSVSRIVFDVLWESWLSTWIDDALLKFCLELYHSGCLLGWTSCWLESQLQFAELCSYWRSRWDCYDSR